jgi:selenobiotic family peptide radical SAM maturase
MDKTNNCLYSECRKVPENWRRLFFKNQPLTDPETFINTFNRTGDQVVPESLPDLARLECIINKISSMNDISHRADQICINPSVQLLKISWKNLLSLFEDVDPELKNQPEPGKEMILLWKNPETDEVTFCPASNEDLLVLKMLAEDIKPEKVAEEGNIPIGAVCQAIDRAISKGILFSPGSRLKRDPLIFSSNEYINESFLSSNSFTLQWHITQACDLHCRHCYDRSTRSHMTFEHAIKILDDLITFCRKRYVKGSISFTGGNPFLYPNFIEIYRAASERGFSLSILGNPVSRQQLEEIVAIQKPGYFQVSLEGLPEYNDFIRGEGHFNRIIEFLKLLREMNIFSMVMLTLTKDNIRQIIPLGEMLRDLTDRFHFNRLSMVGEGANLKLPEKNGYISFLESYVKATETNPVLGLKDNLFNILRYENGIKTFGGCTGYGCGAAFNFLAVLPDGEVHACRKFPSPIGNVFYQNIDEIYGSETAIRYRSGCAECRNCSIRPVCGGCFASSFSHGLNIFEEKDPFCFISSDTPKNFNHKE